MTDGMKWREPPPNTTYNWVQIGRDLRSRPNQWLLIFENGSMAMVNAVRQGVNGLRPVYRRGSDEPGFEIRTRNNQPGPPRSADMYLRWRDPSREEN